MSGVCGLSDEISYHILAVDALDFLFSYSMIQCDLARVEFFAAPLHVGPNERLLLVESKSVLVRTGYHHVSPDLRVICSHFITFRGLLLRLSNLTLILRMESKPIFTLSRWDIIVEHGGSLDVFLAKVLRLRRTDYLAL